MDRQSLFGWLSSVQANFRMMIEKEIEITLLK